MSLDMNLCSLKKDADVKGKYGFIGTHLGYWRNAHNILQWFRDNLKSAKGKIEECIYYRVEKDELSNLKRYCLDSLKEKNVPDNEINQLGEIRDYLFGDYSQEDWNIECLKRTIYTIDTIFNGGVENCGSWNDGDPVEKVDWDTHEVYFCAW